MPHDEQVNVLEEIDMWLGDQAAEITSPWVSVSTRSAYSPIQGMAKAREAAARCQQLLRSKQQDGRIIRKLAREVREYQEQAKRVEE